MACKAQEGCEEMVLAQPCSVAGAGAGHARSEADARPDSVLPAVPLSVLSGRAQPCSSLPSLWGLWRPSVPAGRARASSPCRWECV